jgi:hypothetical protein
MGKKIYLDEKLVIKEYLKGKSSIKLAEEFNVSKPKILGILKSHNVTRYRDRCKSLKIIKKNDKYVTTRKCPKCGCDVTVSSTNKTITCRNYYNLQKSLCKKCGLENQIGEGNPFYGKTHSKESKEKISNSRKGKATGKGNSMANPKHRKKASSNLKKKWDSGDLDYLRVLFSKKLKETRRQGKIKSIIRSKKEKEIASQIKKMKYVVKESFKVDTKICDIYLPELNLIIEYNGDYWHCNPKKYDENFFNKSKNKTAKEIWEYDKNKIDLIRGYGYNLEIVWESDLKQDPSIINKIIKNYDRK